MHILVVAGDNYYETFKFSLFSCTFEERFVGLKIFIFSLFVCVKKYLVLKKKKFKCGNMAYIFVYKNQKGSIVSLLIYFVVCMYSWHALLMVFEPLKNIPWNLESINWLDNVYRIIIFKKIYIYL